MAMDRLLERLRRGAGPPLRISEFAAVVGYSVKTVRKLIDSDAIETVGLTGEQRIPIREAVRVARGLGVLEK